MSQINVRSTSQDWRAAALSNFPAFSFMLDDKVLASVEGFIQGIKFPVGHPTREIAFSSAGQYAKRLGVEAERKLVWWGGKVFHYGSDAHHKLIERAIRAKFEQNAEAMHALIATHGMKIIHNTGEKELPTTSLPSTIFCDILTRIREETLRNAKPAPCFKRGGSVTLIEMPDGCESKDYKLTLGKTYEFIEWSGSNVIITTDVPNETASIHYARVEYNGCEC